MLPAGAAAMIELLSEPLYILAQTRLLFGLRVLVETLAIVTKASLTLLLLHTDAAAPAIALSWAQACLCVGHLLCVLHCGPTYVDLPLPLQIAYAAVILVGYIAYFAPEVAAREAVTFNCSWHTTAAGTVKSGTAFRQSASRRDFSSRQSLRSCNSEPADPQHAVAEAESAKS